MVDPSKLNAALADLQSKVAANADVLSSAAQAITGTIEAIKENVGPITPQMQSAFATVFAFALKLADAVVANTKK